MVASQQEEESGLGPTLPRGASVQYICSEEEEALAGVHRPLPNPEMWDGEEVETKSKCPPPPATVRRPALKEHYFISPAPVLKALIFLSHFAGENTRFREVSSPVQLTRLGSCGMEMLQSGLFSIMQIPIPRRGERSSLNKLAQSSRRQRPRLLRFHVLRVPDTRNPKFLKWSHPML